MKTFYDAEQYCCGIFDSLWPFWHLWTPEDAPVVFRNEQDFMDGMGIVGICAKLTPEIKVLTFQLMSNHVHFTLSGPEAEAKSFYETLIALLSNWLKSRKRTVSLDTWTPSLRRIETMSDLRNVIAYNNRNGFLVHPEHTPFSYPWGANRYYFNPEAKLRFSQNADKTLMTVRTKRDLVRSHIADGVAGPAMSDGYACPLDYCDIELGEKLFRNATHYLNHITRNVESQKTIAAEIGERIFYTDEELFNVVCTLSKQASGQFSPATLPKEMKTSIAKTLHFEYNAGNKQIARMLRMDLGVVNAMFPKQ